MKKVTVHNFHQIFLAVLLLWSMLPLAAEPLEKRPWTEYRSDNFVVYSPVGETKAVELLKHMEILRALVPSILTVELSTEPVPTRILFIKNKATIRKLGINARSGGRFFEGLRENFIVVRDSKFGSPDARLAYAYVRYLLRNASDVPLPFWLIEGFSRYAGSVELTSYNSVVELGSMRRRLSKRQPNCEQEVLDYLISGVEPRGCRHFRASWKIVQVLVQESVFVENTKSYLARVARGDNRLESFTHAYNVNFAEFKEKFIRFGTQGDYKTMRINTDDLIYDFSSEARPMSYAEVNLVLGEAALKRRQLNQAVYWLTQATEAKEQYEQAWAGLAIAHLYDENVDQAEIAANKAIEFNPDNVNVLLDAAKVYLRKAFDEDDNVARDSHLVRVRKLVGKAWKLDDSNPEVYGLYGRSYLLQQEFEKALDTLEAASRLLPAHVGIRVDLIQSYLLLDRKEESERHGAMEVHYGRLWYAYHDQYKFLSSQSSEDQRTIRLRDDLDDGPSGAKTADAEEFWY